MNDLPTQPRPSTTHTSIEVRSPAGEISVEGPALAVIAIVAMAGFVWLGTRFANLSRFAMDRPRDGSKSANNQ